MEILDKEIVERGFRKELYASTKKVLSRGGQHVVMTFELISPNGDLPKYIARKDVQIQRLHGEDMREYRILRECRHPNILTLFYWEHVRIEHYEHLHFYTELCDQNLRTFIKENQLHPQDIKVLSLQMLQGCQYLHDKNVAHRDIKPENVLVNKGASPSLATLKLADFGLSRLIPGASSISTTIQVTACGTRPYMSPEMTDAFDNGHGLQSKCAFATDMFSLGVVIFEMIEKRLPFTLKELRKRSKFDLAKTRIDNENPNVPDGVRSMLHWNSRLRPSSKEAQNYFSTKEQVCRDLCIDIAQGTSSTSQVVTKRGDQTVLTDYENWSFSYDKAARLGKGIFGQVFEYKLKVGKKSDLPDTIAVKQMTNLRMKNPSLAEIKEMEMLKTEIYLLMELKHENLINMYRITEDVFHYYLIMELCDENLKQFLRRRKDNAEVDGQNTGCESAIVASFGKQIMDAFTYIHNYTFRGKPRPIMHRDMKSENVLLTYGVPKTDLFRIRIKLCDFGLSRFMPEQSKVDITVCGTRSHMAPEVAIADAHLQDKSKITLEADIFSIGVVLYEISTNSLPHFPTINVTENHWNLNFLSQSIADENLRALLRKMFAWNPQERPSATKVRSDPFFDDDIFVTKSNTSTNTIEDSTSDSDADDSCLRKDNFKKDLIAKGTFGNVYKLTYAGKEENPYPHDVVAVKEILFTQETDSERNKEMISFAKREASVLTIIHHPNILECFAIYSRKNKIKLVLEYCETTLKKIVGQKRLVISDLKCLGAQIITGLSYLHSKGIVHRDMKSNNILVKYKDDLLEPYTLKICDFNLSLYHPYKNNSFTRSVAGTSYYMAPEIHFNQEVNMDKVDINTHYTKSADIFSTGVTLYEMVAGEYPFTKTDLLNRPGNMLKIEQLEDTQIRELLMRMCDFDPAARPTVEEVGRSQFFFQLGDQESKLPVNDFTSDAETNASKDDGDEEEDQVSISLSAEAGQLSEVLRKIAQGADRSLVASGQGIQGCVELIREGKIKVGHIICMVRSYAYNLLQDLKMQDPSQLIAVLKQAQQRGTFHILDRIGRRQQMKRYQEDSKVAYMQMAIYVGEIEVAGGETRYIVAEAAGCENPVTRIGRIRLLELKESFNDFPDDESAFFVIKPFKDRNTVQQNALATVIEGLEYEYHIKWFNCEAYTSICAGFQDDASDAHFEAAHQKRAMLKEKKNAEMLEEEREKWFNPYKIKMLEIFSKRKNDIDGNLLVLKLDPRNNDVTVGNRKERN